MTFFEQTKEDFLRGDVRFLTVRGTKSKHQKIGFVSDLCRKISATYLIVKEKNKQNEQYHFHAILKVRKNPKSSWFKKGLHMNLKKVGKTTKDTPYLEKKEQIEHSDRKRKAEFTELCKNHTVAEAVEIRQHDDLMKSLTKKYIEQEGHVARVLAYMSKDVEFPIQYKDYIFSKAGKMTKLEGG